MAPQACRFLNVEQHHFHSSYQKSITERTVQYIKDRTKCFDDYFPCRGTITSTSTRDSALQFDNSSTLLFRSLVLFLIVTSVTPAASAISTCDLFSPVLRHDR